MFLMQAVPLVILKAGSTWLQFAVRWDICTGPCLHCTANSFYTNCVFAIVATAHIWRCSISFSSSSNPACFEGLHTAIGYCVASSTHSSD
jgi:hypothetical protein